MQNAVEGERGRVGRKKKAEDLAVDKKLGALNTAASLFGNPRGLPRTMFVSKFVVFIYDCSLSSRWKECKW